MKKIKQILFRLFFGLEIILFIQMYVGGANGLAGIKEIECETVHIEKQIAHLNEEIALIDAKKVAWQENCFYKEKLAREQLHMARVDEEIFYID